MRKNLLILDFNQSHDINYYLINKHISIRLYYMKKSTLSLLISTSILFNNLSNPTLITNIGFLQIITADQSNAFAAGTINLSGII